jgi:hypothetical protein
MPEDLMEAKQAIKDNSLTFAMNILKIRKKYGI